MRSVMLPIIARMSSGHPLWRTYSLDSYQGMRDFARMVGHRVGSERVEYLGMYMDGRFRVRVYRHSPRQITRNAG